MFKIVGDPKRIVDLFRKALLGDLFVGSLLRFNKDEIVTSAYYGMYGAYATYKPAFFKEYICDGATDLELTKVFVKNFAEQGFPSYESCSVESDMVNNRLLIVAGGLRWFPNVSNPNVDTVGFNDSKLPMIFTDGVGYLPVNLKKQPIHFQAKINISKLNIPKAGEFLYLKPTDKMLMLEWDLDGNAELDIPLTPEAVSVPHAVTVTDGKDKYKFHLSYFKDILSNFGGEVTMTVYERAIFFNSVSPEKTLTYFLATA
jgi:hypothetical protein